MLNKRESINFPTAIISNLPYLTQNSMKLQTSHNSFANNYYTYSIAATRGEEIIKWVPYYFAKKTIKS